MTCTVSKNLDEKYDHKKAKVIIMIINLTHLLMETERLNAIKLFPHVKIFL